MLRGLGATLQRERHFEDNVFLDDATGSLRQAGRVLRLRRAAGGALLTAKGPGRVASDVKSRTEVETAVPDPDALLRVLSLIGLEPRFRYQKYRETWAHAGVEIVVDETPIGTFLEVEGAASAIHVAAAALGFSREDYVLKSYPALFAAAGGRGDMVFPG